MMTGSRCVAQARRGAAPAMMLALVFVLSGATARAANFPAGQQGIDVASATGGADESREAAEAPSPWPRFRGPNGSGVAEVGSLPVEFGPERNVIWSQEVPFGHSSPVVGREHVFVTGTDAGSLVVVALSRRSGEVAWRVTLDAGYEAEMYRENDAASPTPATDGDNVYALFGTYGLVAIDGEGQILWQLPLGPFDNFYGMASSPILVGDLLVTLVDQARGSYLLAVDAATGRERWRRERLGRVESWTTPVVYPAAGQPEQILVVGSQWVDAYQVHTGEPFWQHGKVGYAPVASPVLVGDLLIAAAPDNGGYMPATFSSLLTRGDADGDGALDLDEMSSLQEMEVWIPHFGYLDMDDDERLEQDEYQTIAAAAGTDDFGAVALRLPVPGSGATVEESWRERRSVPYIVTPIAYEGLLYLVTDAGIVSALDAETGRVVKRARLSRAGTQVSASPVAADGKIYLGTVDGDLAVLSTGPDFEVLAHNDLGEAIAATPALAPGRLLVRTSGHLYAFGHTTDAGDAGYGVGPRNDSAQDAPRVPVWN